MVSGPCPARPRSTSYDHVYRALVRHALLSRRLAPGTRVVEAALAYQLQVSRTPVRDAMRRLEGDGLLERVAGGGLGVVEFNDDDVGDVFLVRSVIEELVAELATRRNKEGDWERLRDMARALGPTAAEHGTASYQFGAAHDRLHSAIYEMAFSPRVAAMLIDRVMGLVVIAGGFSYRDDGHHEPVVQQHLDLLDALASGRSRRAKAAVAEHLAAARRARPAPPLTGQAVSDPEGTVGRGPSPPTRPPPTPTRRG